MGRSVTLPIWVVTVTKSCLRYSLVKCCVLKWLRSQRASGKYSGLSDSFLTIVEKL